MVTTTRFCLCLLLSFAVAEFSHLASLNTLGGR